MGNCLEITFADVFLDTAYRVPAGCCLLMVFLSNNIDVGPTLQNSPLVSYRPYGRYLMFCFGDPSSLRSVGMTLQRCPGATAISLLFFVVDDVLISLRNFVARLSYKQEDSFLQYIIF